jgi:hypothetical protein
MNSKHTNINQHNGAEGGLRDLMKQCDEENVLTEEGNTS